MMRNSRPAPERLTAFLLTLLLVLTGAGQDGYGLHPCPHHDSMAAAIASSTDPPQADAGPNAAAPMHMAGHAHGHGDAHAAAPHGGAPVHEGSHDHGACTCVGACQLATPALPVLASAASFVPAPGAVVRTRAEYPHPELLPGRPRFVLPPSIAPPRRG
ncbi:MAG TPA: hypothetical protein VFE05_01605 [Longimicrobiaceae bacterium]|jgi:hypothetical protein|nr:hypothetical protein [Longimicrobiaceae bacterium]